MTALNSRAPVTTAAIDARLAHAVWRADQMGSYRKPVTASGQHDLDRELPDGGWPASTLIELLLQQPGIGEMRLLKPALAAIARERRVALLQPPHAPQAGAWSAWGLAPERLLWIKAGRGADALWSAEQILHNGSCGALLLWQPQVRTEALRRLHLAAQSGNTVFWMLRPLAAAGEASPAPLRLALRPAPRGIAVDIVKRRGPHRDAPLYLRLDGMPSGVFSAASRSISTSISTSTLYSDATLDSRAPAAVGAGSVPAALV